MGAKRIKEQVLIIGLLFQDIQIVNIVMPIQLVHLNKWLKPYIPENCVVHSLRHSFRDRLRSVEVLIIDRLGGWLKLE